jgi:transposase-like protein
MYSNNREEVPRKMSKRRTFTDEFKTMIAELVLSGKTPKVVATA